MSYPYQNQPGYPPQYPGQYPPPKKNNGLVIGLAVVAVLAVAGLVVVLLVTGGDDKPSNTPTAGSSTGNTGDVTGSSEALGQKVAQIIQNHDADTAKQLLCKADSAKFMRSLSSLDKTEVTATYKGVKETGDTAEATITMAVAGGAPRDQKINLSKKDAKWCIN